MPAARAAVTPVGESSSATHPAGGAPSARATARKTSGAGLGCATSSPTTTASKARLRPAPASARSTNARRELEARPIGMPRSRRAPTQLDEPGHRRHGAVEAGHDERVELLVERRALGLGAREHPRELDGRDLRRGAQQVAFVVDREARAVAREEVLLGDASTRPRCPRRGRRGRRWRRRWASRPHDVRSPPVHVWTHDRFAFPLPAGHGFPLPKYRLLRERVVADGLASPREVHEPDPVAWADLGVVQDAGLLERIRTGALSVREQRGLGLPWSPELVGARPALRRRDGRGRLPRARARRGPEPRRRLAPRRPRLRARVLPLQRRRHGDRPAARRGRAAAHARRRLRRPPGRRDRAAPRRGRRPRRLHALAARGAQLPVPADRLRPRRRAADRHRATRATSPRSTARSSARSTARPRSSRSTSRARTRGRATASGASP